MAISILFTLACCLFGTIGGNAWMMADPIPEESQVHIQRFENGFKVYVHEKPSADHKSSFRLVVRRPSEEILFSYDGKIESLEQIQFIFDQCAEHLSEYESIPDVALIAVGDFPKQATVELIQNQFGSIYFPNKSLAKNPLQIRFNKGSDKIALRMSYPNSPQVTKTYEDLRQHWTCLLLQELYQQRLETYIGTGVGTWVHPRFFFYPSRGSFVVSDEAIEKMLTLIAEQVDFLCKEGFSLEEFAALRLKVLTRLHHLEAAVPFADSSFLASYYADQFFLVDGCLGLEKFFSISLQMVDEIEPNDLMQCLPTFFASDKRLVRFVFPHIFLDQMEREDLEKIVDERLSLLLPSLPPSANENPLSSSFRLDFEEPSAFVFASYNEPVEFQFAESAPIISINHVSDPVEPYYQLPLNDKEKRLIRSIFTNMAEKNIIQLAVMKRSMEAKGKKVNHVHPIRFIGYIFSNPDLKSCMRKIVKSSFKWDAFVDGFSRRMKEEYSNNNLYRHISGFCNDVGAHPDHVARFIEKKDWEGLVRSLL